MKIKVPGITPLLDYVIAEKGPSYPQMFHPCGYIVIVSNQESDFSTSSNDFSQLNFSKADPKP